MSERLLPCPFCGGEAITGVGVENGKPYYWVECLSCRVYTDDFIDEISAILGWNRRENERA